MLQHTTLPDDCRPRSPHPVVGWGWWCPLLGLLEEGAFFPLLILPFLLSPAHPCENACVHPPPPTLLSRTRDPGRGRSAAVCLGFSPQVKQVQPHVEGTASTSSLAACWSWEAGRSKLGFALPGHRLPSDTPAGALGLARVHRIAAWPGWVCRASS